MRLYLITWYKHFIQSNLQCIQGTVYILSVCLFPGQLTTFLSVASCSKVELPQHHMYGVCFGKPAVQTEAGQWGILHTQKSFCEEKKLQNKYQTYIKNIKITQMKHVQRGNGYDNRPNVNL